MRSAIWVAVGGLRWSCVLGSRKATLERVVSISRVVFRRMLSTLQHLKTFEVDDRSTQTTALTTGLDLLPAGSGLWNLEAGSVIRRGNLHPVLVLRLQPEFIKLLAIPDGQKSNSFWTCISKPQPEFLHRIHLGRNNEPFRSNSDSMVREVGLRL